MFRDLINEVLRAMLAHKLRTFLSLLGIAIGVAAVIIIVAVGQGSQAKIRSAVASMGTNLLVVISGWSTAFGVRSGGGFAPTLTLGDARAITGLPSVGAVAPVVPANARLNFAASNWYTTVYGVTPLYLEVLGWPLVAGSNFSEEDMSAMSRSIIVGQTVVEKLFGDEAPLGKVVRIGNSPYTVIGVLGRRGQSYDGRDMDDTILVPFSTAQHPLFRVKFPESFRFMFVQSTTEEALPTVEQRVIALLRERHELAEHEDNNFFVRNLAAAAETQAKTSGALATLLTSVAAMSLLVGSIGVMNIMLVVVTERKREIGIRMALGACTHHILTQFLLEALIVSALGCVCGIVLGVAGAWLVAATTDTVVVISARSILIAAAVASTVGILAGCYPAGRAARLKIVDALRI